MICQDWSTPWQFKIIFRVITEDNLSAPNEEALARDSACYHNQAGYARGDGDMLAQLTDTHDGAVGRSYIQSNRQTIVWERVAGNFKM